MKQTQNKQLEGRDAVLETDAIKKMNNMAGETNQAAHVPAVDNNQSVLEELALVKEQLRLATEREKRILADYQNLQRRFQEEKLTIIKMANKNLCQALLQPLEHLSLAAASIKNQGLDMVVEQFWKELHNFGLTEIEALGKKFDLKTMEAVGKRGNGEKVVEVVRKGYMLNGEVIQHAGVVLS